MHSEQPVPVQGRYSDGQTAQSSPAEVRLTGRGIEIGFAGTPDALVWPYGALGVATPLTSKSTDALVTYSHMPGATLFIADGETVRQLMKVAPQLTSRAYGWRSARPWIIAAACVVLAFVGLWLAELSPARWVAAMLPDRVRVSVGDQVVASMVGSRKECTAQEGRAALDDLVERLSNASGTGTRFRVRVVDWGLLNAFAVPGEQIVLTRRIITDAKSPEEVAGVLAHEMGHGLELHPETSIVRVIGLTAALELMTGGGGAIANIGLGLTQLSYTRTAEREADARGLALLQKSEIAASGLIDFFRRIGEIERKRGDGKEWSLFRTHPQSEERAKAAAARPTYPTRPALTPEQWQALRSICGTQKANPEPEK
jgi:predicted Zn-dependent protease